MARVSKMHQIESQEGRPIEQIISELYEEYGSQTAVAAKLGIAQGTLSVWLVKLGLKEKLVVVKDQCKTRPGSRASHHTHSTNC